jgi:anhydro-N-acetylmuramic acid kinase
MAIVMGMNSGSSFDGIDVVLAEIQLAADGHPARPVFIDGLSVPWPGEVQDQVLKAFDNKLSIFELTRLNYVAGAVYAEAAKSMLDARGLSPDEVEVIGVDGQTIYQEPPDHAGMAALPADASLVSRWLNGPYPCGLQIGEPAIIAAHCDIPVVWNFRPSDHALGGTGAPLMQYLDFVAFRDIGPVLTLNIGGIANCQLAQRDRSKMMAFDTGPGNVMVDFAASRLYGRDYDADGAIAASGTVHKPMLDELMSHPFFRRRPPRSAWRLDFGSEYAAQILDTYDQLPPRDVMATLSAFTATSIAASITDHVPALDELGVLIASGGGVRNAALMGMIAERLPARMRLTTSAEFGIPPQFKEAVKFATLAYATQRGLANNIPAASGAVRFAILGKTVQPPRFAREHLPVSPPTQAGIDPGSDHNACKGAD